MSQQINLLDPSLRPQREWLTLSSVALGMLAVLVLLVFAAVWGWHQESLERDRFRVAENDLHVAQAELTELASRQSRQGIDTRLQADVNQAALVLQGKREIMAVIEQGGLGEKTGFSAYLQGFARQTVKGIWITGFDLTAGKKTFEVRGRMLQEHLLPNLVQQLNQEPIFKGRRFAALDMHREALDKPVDAVQSSAAKKSPVIEFILLGDAVKPEGKP